jgi:hypothetical protein
VTQENKRKNVAEELSRSSECLKEADVLQRSELYSGAVSRLYYHVLHGVRALLLSKGLEPKTHEGVLRLLSMHFVKEGIFDVETSHIAARLMKFREEADYNPSFQFTESDYKRFRGEAGILLGKIREYLKRDGLIDSKE